MENAAPPLLPATPEDAAAAYDAARRLIESLPQVAPVVQPTAIQLALRAALHPALLPFLRDPLLPLDGQFPSLDAQVAGALQFAAARGQKTSALAALTAADQTVLHRAGLTTTAAFAPDPTQSNLPQVGRITGALYVPGREQAALCVVRAVCLNDTISGSLNAWPDPMPLRPCSVDVIRSARAALSVALHVGAQWERETPLWPAPIFFDVTAAALTDDELCRVAGDSLGLPLTLALLSALCHLPISPQVAATGQVALQQGVDRILSVSWVAEKAAALPPEINCLLAPASTPSAMLPGPSDAVEIVPVSRVAEAMRHASSALLPVTESSAPDASVGLFAAPVGAVTFVIGEVDNAAHYWETDAGAMRDALTALDRLLRQATRPGGFRFLLGDDRFGIAFADTHDACHTALRLQSAITAYPWPDAVARFGVRVGVHRGAADRFQGEYYSPALAQAGRLRDAANRGQILLSRSVAELLSAHETPPDWRQRRLGTFRLPDLIEPMELWQLSRPPLPEQFDPPRTLDARRHNLPIQATPLVGRETEIPMLIGLLRGRGTRLVTLTGPGGVGKTRLALQVGAEVVDSFPDGVWFVSLADLPDDEREIARVIETTLRAGQALLGAPPAMFDENSANSGAQLATLLREKRLLLVLDNAETVPEATAAIVSRLLREAPDLLCLVTSRALLQVRGEQRYDVPPLDVPAADTEVEEMRRSAAVSLFCDQAQAARAQNWQPSGDDIAAIRGICARLDGLPLAIELAAARARTFSLSEIAARLTQSFDLLATRQRDIPERQRTIQATLDWSYGLLSEEEKRLLEKLSLFAGGFTAEAAEAVAQNDPLTRDLLDLLEEKSLIVCRITESGARYRLLSLIREFAAQKLAACGEDRIILVRQAYARYFLDQAIRGRAAADTASEDEAFDALEVEMENLRLVFMFLRQTQPENLPGFVEALAEFLRCRGFAVERREWIGIAREIAAQNDLPERLWLELHQAAAEEDRQDWSAARERATQVFEQAEARHEPALAVRALNLLGLISRNLEDLPAARRYHQQARERFARSGDLRMAALTTNNLGLVAWREGQRDEARQYFELVALNEQSDARARAYALNNLALLLDEDGDYARCRELSEEMLEIARNIKNPELVALAYTELANAYEKTGYSDAALTQYAAAEAIFALLHHRYHETVAAYLDGFGESKLRERIRTLRADLRGKPLATLIRLPLPLRYLDCAVNES